MIERLRLFFDNISNLRHKYNALVIENDGLKETITLNNDNILNKQSKITELQKELTLATIEILELKEQIKISEEPFIKTITRVDSISGKWDVSLDNRLEKAVQEGSKLHISIHANAFGTTWNTAYGCEGFYSTDRTKELVDDIQAEAGKIERNRGTKKANFFITREFPKKGIESVLFEGPFMTNKEDLKKLKSDTFRKQMANIYANGIIDYCKKYNITNISIGAGHGHETPGKRAFDGSLREWDYNSKVVQYIIEVLRAAKA